MATIPHARQDAAVLNQGRQRDWRFFGWIAANCLGLNGLNIFHSYLYFGGLMLVWVLLSPRYGEPACTRLVSTVGVLNQGR